MNNIQNQFSNSIKSCAACLAVALTLVVCQQSIGQSVATPPKVWPKAAIEAEIEEAERMMAQFDSQLEGAKSAYVQSEKEYEELKKRETSLSVSEESYPEVLRTLHSQRVQLSIDLAGIEARHAAIASAIKTLVENQNDEIVKPFKRLVELRQAKYDRLMVSDSATAKEKQEAEIKLFEARLRLADASKPSGSLSHLNSQLLDTSLERAEKTARLEKANSLFKEVDEYKNYRDALATTKRKSRSSQILQSKIKMEQVDFQQKIKSLRARLSELEK